MFTQSLDGGAPALVYSDPGVGGLGDVSPDGARGLFMRFPALDDNRLLTVDLKTGATHLLYPPEGKAVSIHSAGFSEDGKRVLVSDRRRG